MNDEYTKVANEILDQHQLLFYKIRILELEQQNQLLKKELVEINEVLRELKDGKSLRDIRHPYEPSGT